jgi:hypothetical protein
MIRSSATPEEAFRNLIPAEGYFFPFIDRFAQFGIVFEPGRPIGPGMMAMRSTVLTNQPSDGLYQLWLRRGKETVPCARRSMEHLPWRLLEETDVAGLGLAITAEHIFLNERVLASRFRLTNRSETEIDTECTYAGLATGDRFCREPRQLRAYDQPMDLPLRQNWVRAAGQRVSAGLRNLVGELPEPTFHLRVREADGLSASCSTEPVWMDGPRQSALETDQPTGLHYFFTGRIKLAPNATAEHIFTTELSVATHACREPLMHDSAPDTLDFDAAVEASKAAFLERIDWENPPAVRSPLYLNKAWRARWALTRTGYQADENGGAYGRNIASTCTADNGGFTRNFFWDGLFSSAAAATFHPELAKGAIRTVFSRICPQTGFGPEHTYNYGVPTYGPLAQMQAPVATWAVDKYLAAQPGDEAFLKEIYPTLKLVHTHWLTCADRDGDGLMEWQFGGQTADDSPLYDAYGEKNCWLGPQASVQLNAFLHRDAMTLARFAERLGIDADARWAREEAAKRQERFFQLCYLPQEKRFWDYSHLMRRHINIKTFYLFWPIWAGMDVPADAKKDLIENVLLDPKQFFGAVPFPSVAYDEPTYDEKAYWRGRAWPQISYWLVEMLRAEGYEEAAEEARRRLLGAWMRFPGFAENTRTDAAKYEMGPGSQYDYNWGIAACLMHLTH